MADKKQKYVVDYGEPVGMVAAQSLGEPGTQMILRAFHFAGIESTIATSGLPRIVELVDARKKPATPITYIYLNSEARKNFDKAEAIMKKISEVKMVTIIKRVLENFPKGMIKLIVDEQALNANNLTPSQVAQKISKKFNVSANVEKDKNIILKLKTKNVAEIRTMSVKIMKDVIQGIPDAGKTIIQQNNKTGEFYLISAGSNIRDIIEVDGVDKSKLYTNDVFAMYGLFGIEAARNTIVRELKNTLDEQKIGVDLRHLMLIADAMCYSGSIKGIGRHGLSGQKDSVFAKAAYEETVKHLVNAAAFSEVDNMRGVTENILVGKQIPIGTGSVRLAIKKEDMQKIKTQPKKSK
ncbi:MAG: DNA-directed RNA polymerase subunit A'' [Candidatus Micrarchaeia archaeon]